MDSVAQRSFPSSAQSFSVCWYLALVLVNSGPYGGCHYSWEHDHIPSPKGGVGVAGVREVA